jgi:hypothetical protein
MCVFFMQDKNTVHTTNFSMAAIEEVFGDGVITRGM